MRDLPRTKSGAMDNLRETATDDTARDQVDVSKEDARKITREAGETDSDKRDD